MGRILTALGALLLLAGIGLLVWNAFKPALRFGVPDGAAVAASLCRAGERSTSERGATTYTPGSGHAAPVRYYCVDGAGARREVTGEFAARMMESAGTTVNAAFAAAAGTIWPTLLSVAGALILVLGAVLRRGRGRIRFVVRR